MKATVIILAMALGVVGFLYFQDGQTRQNQAQALHFVQEQLGMVSNRAVTAEGKLAAVKSQMLTRMAELQQSLTTLGSDKIKAEERAKELQARVETVEKELADEKAALASFEIERTKVETKLAIVSNQLTNVQQQLSDLQKTQTATEAELAALRTREMALAAERDSLERRLNDLDELRAQIRLVKHRVWEQHIADWKKRDAEAAVGGNAGVLLNHGQWQR